ncbi:MAG: adenylate cyclase [Gammaproteobacteria bacterium]|nr:adenylate cyclase [Gammaproteobacteria bacterium]
MAPENTQPEDEDLDRTDKLPILEGTPVDADVEDDAVRMDFVPAVPSVNSRFSRSGGAGRPLVAPGTRPEVESEAVTRARALTAELAAARAMLESEQARSRELEKTLRAGNERQQSELRTLRETVAAREATIAQVVHSLRERDAQLSGLQREHAQVVPSLEERSKTAVQLEADLRAARTRCEALALELAASQQSLAAVTAQLDAGKREIDSVRSELNVAKTHAASYLEHLRTREWRRGFDQNLFLELDAKLAARDGAESTPQTGDVTRLTEELAAKALKLDQLAEDHRSSQAALERARSALEERDFLIRRLERSDPAREAVPPQCAAELVRTDGQHKTVHPLGRRTRIGRAPGCELHIDSTSVSRHHALVHLGAREVVIEDLNSTNGVIVNGRRISRQRLNDGDLLTIGEAQFRLTLTPAPPGPEAPGPARQ